MALNGYDYDDAAYDQLMKDADQDGRIGHQKWMVTDIIDDTWPSGDPRRKIKGHLMAFERSQADLTISPPPPPAVVKAESASWPTSKKKAIAQTVTLYRQLASIYKTSPEKINIGDTFYVNIVKTKVVDGKGGFLRVAAFLDEGKEKALKAAEGAKKAEAESADAPPF